MLVYLLFALGLVGLVVGGDYLVKGAVAAAEKLGVSPLVIGLTIVAFGTSAPELLISLEAALSGSPGLAIGNVVGSNIANVLLVMGVPALIAMLQCDQKGVVGLSLFMFALTAFFVWTMQDGTISRFDGTVLLGILVVFLVWQGMRAKAENGSDDYAEEVGDVPKRGWKVALFIVVGLVMLPVGAHLTVTSAVEIAEALGVSEEVIGLTIVAIGTSLPELATGIMAARQGEASVAVGNVVGSNIFNIAAIMGITAFVIPVPVDASILGFDNWVMLACAALVCLLAFTHYCVGRWSGIAFVALYLGYLWTTATI